jgi:hypothetical protein
MLAERRHELGMGRVRRGATVGRRCDVGCRHGRRSEGHRSRSWSAGPECDHRAIGHRPGGGRSSALPAAAALAVAGSMGERRRSLGHGPRRPSQALGVSRGQGSPRSRCAGSRPAGSTGRPLRRTPVVPPRCPAGPGRSSPHPGACGHRPHHGNLPEAHRRHRRPPRGVLRLRRHEPDQGCPDPIAAHPWGQERRRRRPKRRCALRVARSSAGSRRTSNSLGARWR